MYEPSSVDTPHDRTFHGMGDAKKTLGHTRADGLIDFIGLLSSCFKWILAQDAYNILFAYGKWNYRAANELSYLKFTRQK